MLLEELRGRITTYLSKHGVCVVSTSGTVGIWAMPALCVNRDLIVECLLPGWADISYYIEQDPRVLLIIYDSNVQWMQYWGMARLMPAQDWGSLLSAAVSGVRLDERYEAISIVPQRIDLFDESKGWGARETLDF